jgi:SAM-dependent methyltransferase
MPDRFIATTDDTLSLLDELLDGWDGGWWNGFFTDRTRSIPFFVDWPDENLVEWSDQGRLAPGRVLELGSGPGRNAVFLAGRGSQVDTVDFSAEAVGWAKERALAAGVAVNAQCGNIFDVVIEDGGYDLVYDSGCFHHLAPHRRPAYLALVNGALKPGGRFGLVCFRPEGGSEFTDRQVYENRSLGGGLGYTEPQLRTLFDVAPFSVDVLRPMLAQDGSGPAFGQDFLWALLATKTPKTPKTTRACG